MDISSVITFCQLSQRAPKEVKLVDRYSPHHPRCDGRLTEVAAWRRARRRAACMYYGLDLGTSMAGSTTRPGLLSDNQCVEGGGENRRRHPHFLQLITQET